MSEPRSMLAIAEAMDKDTRKRFLETFNEVFDSYCLEAQECEDRRWTKKEADRMSDIALAVQVVFQ